MLINAILKFQSYLFPVNLAIIQLARIWKKWLDFPEIEMSGNKISSLSMTFKKHILNASLCQLAFIIS